MRLKEFRLQRKLTQEAVARHLGMPTKTYQNYEREVREADTDVLCALADLYGTTLDELVGRTSGDGSPLMTDAPCPGPDDFEELARLYRSMSDEGRDAMMAVARGLLEVFRRDDGWR